MGERDKQAGTAWVLPSIAGILLLLSLVVPMKCDASLNETHYDLPDGGAAMFGAFAIGLAGLAILRKRGFSGPAIVAVVIALLGGVQIAHGVMTAKRQPSAAEAVDLDGAVRRVLSLMSDDRISDLTGILPPTATPDELHMIDALARGARRGLGRWQDISGLSQTIDDQGLVVATGEARYERGRPRFELKFAILDGEPRLANIDLTLPASARPPAADAEALARVVTMAIAADDVDSIHAALDPRLDSSKLDEAFRRIHEHDPLPVIELVSHTTCDEGECFELRFPLRGGQQRVRLQTGWTFGVWMVTSMTLGDG